MKKYLYKGLQVALDRVARGLVVSKKLAGTSLTLHYEVSQYLGFLFQRQIAYEKTLQDKLRPFISADSLIFDVGSNIGQYALWFSSLATAGKVVCFEPDTKNHAFLSFNVAFNELANVVVNNLGLGEAAARQEFYRDTRTGGRKGSLSKTFVGDSFEGAVQQVEISTLDEQIRTHGSPDFVKIDVEGFEEAVLRGLAAPDPATVFFVEVRASTAAPVFDYFSGHGFSCTMLDSDPSREIANPSEIPGFCNLLFRH